MPTPLGHECVDGFRFDLAAVAWPVGRFDEPAAHGPVLFGVADRGTDSTASAAALQGRQLPPAGRNGERSCGACGLARRRHAPGFGGAPPPRRSTKLDTGGRRRVNRPPHLPTFHRDVVPVAAVLARQPAAAGLAGAELVRLQLARRPRVTPTACTGPLVHLPDRAVPCRRVRHRAEAICRDGELGWSTGGWTTAGNVQATPLRALHQRLRPSSHGAPCRPVRQDGTGRDVTTGGGGGNEHGVTPLATYRHCTGSCGDAAHLILDPRRGNHLRHPGWFSAAERTRYLLIAFA